MKITTATMNTLAQDHLKSFRAVQRTDSPETNSFKSDALTLSDGALKASLEATKFSASSVTTKLGDAVITFNNSSGAITWNGKALNLKGIADPLSERTLILQWDETSQSINVFRGDDKNGFRLTADGSQVFHADGHLDLHSVAKDKDAASLIINNANMENASNGGAGNDVIINRQNTGTISAGGGDDMIFNFGKGAVSLQGDAGNDAIFSVATTGATIDGGEGDSYIKLAGKMAEGALTMGAGKNIIDATGMSILNTSITAGGSSTALIAKDITSTDPAKAITLNSAMVGVDVGTLGASLTLGTGINSVAADNVVGQDAANKITITSKGTDSFQFKTLRFAKIDSSTASASTSSVINVTGSAQSSEFALGAGENMLDALGKTLTSVKITDASVGAVTTIRAGSITGTAAAKSEIALKGSGDDAVGNGIAVTGAVNYSEIDTGDGTGTITVGSLNNSTLKAGDAGSKSQTIEILGALTNSSVKTGAGADTVTIGGSATNVTLELGNGANEASIAKNAVELAYTGGADADTLTITGSLTNSGGAAIDMGNGANNLSAGSAKGLQYAGGTGDDSVRLYGALSGSSSIDLGSGTNSFVAQNAAGKNMAVSDASITSEGNTTIIAGKYTTGSAGNTINLAGGNASTHSVTLDSIASTKNAILTMILGGSTNTANQTLTVNGSVSGLDYWGAAGDDSVSIAGALINSSLNLYDSGANGNSLTVESAAGKAQAITNTDIVASGATTIVGGVFTAGKGHGPGNVISLTGVANAAHSVSLASIGAATGGSLTITLGGSTSTAAQALTVDGAVKGLSYMGSGGADVINVAGAISASSFDLYGGANTLQASKKDKNNNDVGQSMSDVSIRASGSGTNTIFGGAYKTNAKFGNTIALENTGVNTVTLSSITGAAGVGALDMTLGGSGSTATQTLTVAGATKYLNYVGSRGIDEILLQGAVAESTFALDDGANTFTAKNSKDVYQTLTNVGITGGAGNDVIKAGAYKSSGVRDDLAINLGEGANTLELAGAVSAAAKARLEIVMGAAGSTDAQTLTIGGAAANVDYSSGDGDDNITIAGAVSNSAFDLGKGSNTFAAVKAVKGVDVYQAMSNVSISAQGTGNNTITGGAYTGGAIGGITLASTGNNTVNLNSISSKGTMVDITLGTDAAAGVHKLTVAGAVTGLNYVGSGGVDELMVNGPVTDSDFDLGNGNNTFAAVKSGVGQKLNNVGIKGGSGNDLIVYGSYNPGKSGKHISLGGGDNNLIGGPELLP